MPLGPAEGGGPGPASPAGRLERHASLSATAPVLFPNKWLPGEIILGVFEQEKASKPSPSGRLVPQDRRALPGRDALAQPGGSGDSAPRAAIPSPW